MSRVTLRHLFSGIRRRPSKNRAILNVEGLEERRNPVTASFDSGTGILDVQGTGSGLNDRIIVIQNGSGISVLNGFTNQFVPITNGATFTFTIDATIVTGITV